MNKQEKFISPDDIKKVNVELDKPEENDGLKIKDDLIIFKTPVEAFHHAKVPRNIIILALALTFIGFGLIIAGCVQYTKYNDPTKCLAYWIIGGFCAIPGFFYAGKLIKFWRSQNEDERRDIISEMPEWN